MPSRTRLEASMQEYGKLSIYRPTAQRVARTMVSSGAYLISPSDFFTWKSGLRAPVYTDCREMMHHPGGSTMLKKALGSATLSFFGQPDYVVGIADAGIFWSSLVADELHTRHAFVRKQPKNHGVGGLVVGIPKRSDRLDNITAVVVDDLVASGGSLLRAIDAIRDETHVEVLGIVSVVNWNFLAMRDRMRDLRIPIASLISYPDLLDEALAGQLITAPQRHELLQFYREPRGHKWSPNFGSVAGEEDVNGFPEMGSVRE